jgi:transcriptional regulator with XRE-family HTH domain
MPKAAKSAVTPKVAAPAKPKTTDAREDQSIEAALGSQVRHLRSQLGITASELAHEAGVSASALSKIENGQISPSLATLQALARALHVPVSALFSQFEESRDCSYVAAGEGMRLERRGTRAGHEYQLLGHPLSGPVTVEPYLIRLAQDSQAYTSFRHAGQEFIYMLTGRVRYRHGDRTFVLNPGDSLFFDSGSSHGPEEMGKAPCSYLSIIISPKQA